MQFPMDDVLTIKEAAEIWNLDASTIRYAILQNRFPSSEIKKSCGTWIISRNAMVTVYGFAEQNEMYIYTIGYEGKTIDTFIQELHNNNIHTVFDVRGIPLSRKKGFSKNVLSEFLRDSNIGYYNFKELGSPKDIREELYRTWDYTIFFNRYVGYLKNHPELLEIIVNAIKVSTDKNFCLMCFEKNPKTCHRSVLAKEIQSIVPSIKRIINI